MTTVIKLIRRPSEENVQESKSHKVIMAIIQLGPGFRNLGEA